MGKDKGKPNSKLIITKHNFKYIMNEISHNKNKEKNHKMS